MPAGRLFLWSLILLPVKCGAAVPIAIGTPRIFFISIVPSSILFVLMVSVAVSWKGLGMKQKYAIGNSHSSKAKIEYSQGKNDYSEENRSYSLGNIDYSIAKNRYSEANGHYSKENSRYSDWNNDYSVKKQVN